MFLLLPVRAGGQIIYVNQAAAGVDNGSSWIDAYVDLQDALAAANPGDEIWVATGVYTPGVQSSDTFQLLDDVALYGGFAATETVRSQRDWLANVTVLSGDIDGDDTTNAQGVVTDTANIVGTNSSHVTTGSGVTTTAQLDGFVVTGGQAASGFFCPDNCGGGMFNESGHPRLTYVSFSGNFAAFGGGGIYNNLSSSSLDNVSFSGNSAATWGGGMLNDGSNPSLINVSFNSNSAAQGGGIYNYDSSSSLIHVSFIGNFADWGGGIFNDLSNPNLANVSFST